LMCKEEEEEEDDPRIGGYMAKDATLGGGGNTMCGTFKVPICLCWRL